MPSCCMPLLFARGVFANASTRYIWYGGVLYGPFAGGTLATILVGDRLYAQLAPQRWNHIKYSEDFTQWTAMGSASVASNTTVAPDGNTTADTLTFTADAGDGIKMGGMTGSGGDTPNKFHTESIFAKTLSGTKDFRLGFLRKDNTTSYTAKTATTVWQQFDVTADILAGETNHECHIINDVAGTAGDLIIWGAMNETGDGGADAKFVSAYIPCRAGSQVYRYPDGFWWELAAVPTKMKTGEWSIDTIQPAYPGTDAPNGFWIFGSGMTGLDWGGSKVTVWQGVNKVSSNTITWAKGQHMIITVDSYKGTVEVCGAATGNGIVYGDPGDWSNLSIWYFSSTQTRHHLISEPY